MAEIGKQAWFALTNRKKRTSLRRRLEFSGQVVWVASGTNLIYDLAAELW